MKKELKGFIVGCLTTAIISSGVAIASNTKTIEVAENSVTIIANKQRVDAPNFVYNDRTYVPLRAVLELMDCSVNYEEDTKTVYAYNNYVVSEYFPLYLEGNQTPYKEILNLDTAENFVDENILLDAGLSLDQDAANALMKLYKRPSTWNNSYNASPSYSSAPTRITSTSFPLYLYSDEDKPIFLGKLTNNKYDTDSVYNEYGDYGSKYSKTCIFNNYGTYGGEYSKYSPFNKYATNPPIIYDANFFAVGRLTNNTTFTDGYTWEQIDQLMK